jgi:hypothetical protein
MSMRQWLLELAQGWRTEVCANNTGRLREKVGAFALRRPLFLSAHPWRTRRNSPPAGSAEATRNPSDVEFTHSRLNVIS